MERFDQLLHFLTKSQQRFSDTLSAREGIAEIRGFIPDLQVIAQILPPNAEVCKRVEKADLDPTMVAHILQPGAFDNVHLQPTDTEAVERAQVVLNSTNLNALIGPWYQQHSPSIYQQNTYHTSTPAVDASAQTTDSCRVLVEIWLGTEGYRAERRFFQSHEELLDPAVEVLLRERMNTAQTSDSATYEHLETCSHAWLIWQGTKTKRARGIPFEQAVGESYIDRYGGFVLDLPDWLVEVLEQNRSLQGQHASDYAAAARIELWRASLVHSHQEHLAPEITADCLDELSIALNDIMSRDKPTVQEEEINLLQSLLAYYPFDRYPWKWAYIQNSLGVAYGERAGGDRAQNIERAIAAFQSALTVRTPEILPALRATTLNNLATTFSMRIHGERAENLEIAIALYQEVLRIRSFSDLAYDRALAWHNLGAAYAQRVRGDHADNLEAAIQAYAHALDVRTYEDYPYEWALTHHNLGAAYAERILGERAENVEAAIQEGHAALQVFSEDAYPIDYARTLTSLGATYEKRMYGENIDNVLLGITCYRLALRIYEPDSFPVDWAFVQTNLGSAYLDLQDDAAADHTEVALDAFLKSLRVRTIAAQPIAWAEVQSNLARAYWQRFYGDQSVNLEAVLASLIGTFAVFSRESLPFHYRNACLNLAWLADEILFDRGDPRALPLAHAAYAQARLVQSDLAWVAPTPQRKAIVRGSSQAVREMYLRDAWVLWSMGEKRAAVESLEEGRAHALAESLMVNGTAITGLCSEHQESFARIRFRLQQALFSNEPAEAGEARADFIVVRTAIRHCPHCQAPGFLSSVMRYPEIAQAASDSAIIYLAATQRGCLMIGIAAQMAEPSGQLLPHLTSAFVDGWLERRNELGTRVGGYLYVAHRRAERIFANWLEEPTNLEEQHRRLQVPLGELPKHMHGSFMLLRRAIAELVATWQKETEVLMASAKISWQEQGKLLHDCLEASLQDVLQHPTFAAIFVKGARWHIRKCELEWTLDQMQEMFMLPLSFWLHEQGWDRKDQRLALVPCGHLALMPLNAVFIPDRENGSQIPFQETCLLTFQASSRSFAQTQKAAKQFPYQSSLLFVGDPQPTQMSPLAWAETEADLGFVLASQHGRNWGDPITKIEATLPRLRRELQNIKDTQAGVHVIVAAHGIADPRDPRRCYLLLGGSEPLTLHDLQRENLLAGCRAFDVEGCVTALGDAEGAPDEVITLACGVLQAGAAASLATLWSVSDRATFLFAMRRIQSLLGEAIDDLPRALREATHWLRKVQQQELDSLAQNGIQPVTSDQVPGHAMSASLEIMRGIEDPLLLTVDSERLVGDEAFQSLSSTELLIPCSPSDMPFQHPIYWGAFVQFGT